MWRIWFIRRRKLKLPNIIFITCGDLSFVEDFWSQNLSSFLFSWVELFWWFLPACRWCCCGGPSKSWVRNPKLGQGKQVLRTCQRMEYQGVWARIAVESSFRYSLQLERVRRCYSQSRGETQVGGRSFRECQKLPTSGCSRNKRYSFSLILLIFSSLECESGLTSFLYPGTKV